MLNVMQCCSLETYPGTLYSTYDLNTTMIPFLLNYLGDTKAKAKERTIKEGRDICKTFVTSICEL